jgi:hypothetical protein
MIARNDDLRKWDAPQKIARRLELLDGGALRQVA